MLTINLYRPTSTVKEQIHELDQTLTLASQSSRLSYDLYIQPTAMKLWPCTVIAFWLRP